MAEANCKTFHEAKISVYDDLMGKFREGRGEALWLDPYYGIMIQLLLLSKQGVQIGKENYPLSKNYQRLKFTFSCKLNGVII